MSTRTDRITNHALTSEKALERYLVERVKSLGGVCLKYSNPGMVGYPDRICLLSGGRTVWIELKSKGEKPTTMQLIRHSQMSAIGHTVHVCDTRESIDQVLLKPTK
ncbi:MAG: VRR-NUC domain-containing protein [Bacteroidaceae bacterium]|nr:VRR-NUC domain-containing protein [Bacteroidaceae bacterium]